MGARETPRGGSGAMFDRIARRYDLLNRVLSVGLDQGWRRATIDALRLAPGQRVLDVATGTADLALTAARRVPGITVDGIDPSREMLAIGRGKARAAALAPRVALAVGDAQALPFPDATFDAAMIAFGIRNVPDRPRGLSEMRRVTRPGGRVAVLELVEPRSSFARLWVRRIVPRLGALLSGAAEYRYLQTSIAAFPPPAEFATLMRGAGLDVEVVRPMGLGSCCLFVGVVPPAGVALGPAR